MSIWGRIGDRFNTGYALGERIRAQNEKEDEAEAFSALEDAEQASRTAVPTDEPVWAPERPPEQALDLSKGMTARSGGTMNPQTGIATSPEPDFARAQKISPEYHDNIRAARSRLLKAAAARDPSKGLMLKEYFIESDRRQAMNAIGRAMMAAETGDQAGLVENALHAYNLVNDGAHGQVRRVNGNLVGVSYDAKTGAYRGAMLLTPENLPKIAAAISDPLKYREMIRDDARFEMEQDTHALAKRKGEAELEQIEWSKQYREQLMQLQLDTGQATIDSKRATAQYMQDLGAYYTAKRASDANLANAWGSTPEKAFTNFNAAVKRLDTMATQYAEQASAGEGDTPEARVASNPLAMLSARGLAEDMMRTFGPEFTPERALQNALKVKGIEMDLASMPEDARADRLQEMTQTVKLENGRVLVTLDGLQTPIDPRSMPLLHEMLLQAAKKEEANGDEAAGDVARQLESMSAGEKVGAAIGTVAEEPGEYMGFLSPTRAAVGIAGGINTVQDRVMGGLQGFATDVMTGIDAAIPDDEE